MLLLYLADRSGLTPVCWRQPRGLREVQIRRVIDGDTLVDHCQEHIRLLGVDAPEINNPLGHRAAAFTQAWLQKSPHSKVTLAICPQSPRDRHGRLLARIYSLNGDDLANHLLTEGQAWTLPIAPCGEHYVSSDQAALMAAAQHKRGLWAQAITTYVSAANAVTLEQSYVFVEDIVSRHKQNQEHSELTLGQGKNSIVLRIANAQKPAFAAAGLDPASLVAQRLRVQGKLYRKPGQKPRLHLDFPQYLTIVTE